MGIWGQMEHCFCTNLIVLDTVTELPHSHSHPFFGFLLNQDYHFIVLE